MGHAWLRWVKSKLPWGLSIASIAGWPGIAGSASHLLIVQVRPEAALSRQSEGSLLLKIRLAERTQANLWNARTCDTPEPQSYLVIRSGVYTIPLPALPGPAGAGTCLASSDGVIVMFLPGSATAQ